jgi:TolB-like protein/Flp pilus assembly protein TadD
VTRPAKRYRILFAELKRRQVFKIVAVYGAVAFAVMQAADIAFPRLGLPDWTVTFVVALSVIGFPIAAVLAWALELTPEGVKVTDAATSDELEALVAEPAGRRWPAGILALVGIALLVVGGWWVFRDGEDPGTDITAPERSIAVLPFANMSDEPANEYFSDGITDDIIIHLSKIADLKVISRTSSMRYKESDKDLRQIAAELGVATILEGGVQRSGDRVRINARLVDAARDEDLWAEQYNRELTDVFEIQTDVALDIAGALQARLSPDERGRVERTPTEDLEAYNLYLQGRHFWNRRTAEGLRTAIGYFERAIERDSAYAPAWVGLADAYSILANWGYLSPSEALEEAKPAAQRALEIDETLGDAHIALAKILENLEFDLQAARVEYRRGLALSPGYATGHQWYGALLVTLGRHDESIAALERAVELDPLSLIINMSLGAALRAAGEHDRSVRQLQETLQLDPNFTGAYQEIGCTYEEMGALEDAVGAYQRALELSDERIGVAELGHIYGVMGRTDEARGMLRRLEDQARTRYVPPIEFAMIHAGLGEVDAAFRWIERGLDERDATLFWRLDTPGLAELRSDPRYGDLLSRLGLE